MYKYTYICNTYKYIHEYTYVQTYMYIPTSMYNIYKRIYITYMYLCIYTFIYT